MELPEIDLNIKWLRDMSDEEVREFTDLVAASLEFTDQGKELYYEWYLGLREEFKKNHGNE